MAYHAVSMALLGAVLLTGCTGGDSLDRIRARGELVVVSRNSPTTYYLDKSGPTGFEYALAGLLAQDLGVQLKMQTAFSLTGVFRQLQRSEADVAAAGLAMSSARAAVYPHSIPYATLTPQVVYVAGSYRPRSVEDMAGMSISVLEGSSHVKLLRELREGGSAQLQWREIAGADSMALLERVRSGESQLAVVNSNEFAVQQSLYPRLKVAFDLGAERGMVWYLAPGIDNARLRTRIDAFIRRLRDSGTLARLRERHFGHTDGVSRIDSHTFTLNMHNTLPAYRDLIQQVAAEYQLDWRLLAAIAYQESHWDPRATSRTGVRGMMMLTLPTAREMGVKNRLQADQSLRGGARYLKNIKRRLPEDIREPDRTWLALAAYNIGMGHLEDARVLTDRQSGNPGSWRDVMARLPLLQQSKHYRSVKYGYARGFEAVTYVQNIRHYYSILQWQDIPDSKPRPPLRIDDYVPAAIRGSALGAL